MMECMRELLRNSSKAEYYQRGEIGFRKDLAAIHEAIGCSIIVCFRGKGNFILLIVLSQAVSNWSGLSPYCTVV